jgi:hypothetical protein
MKNSFLKVKLFFNLFFQSEGGIYKENLMGVYSAEFGQLFRSKAAPCSD